MSSRRRRAIEDSEDEGDDDVDRSSSSVSGESEGDDEKHVLDDNEPAPKGPEENEEEEDDSSQEWSEDAQVVADGAEGATGDGQEELPKEGKRESRKPRPADPAYVPTQGVFYLHDDRESVSLPRQPRQVREERGQRKPKGPKTAAQKWKHDKFEELVQQDKPLRHPSDSHVDSRSSSDQRERPQRKPTRNGTRYVPVNVATNNSVDASGVSRAQSNRIYKQRDGDKQPAHERKSKSTTRDSHAKGLSVSNRHSDSLKEGRRHGLATRAPKRSWQVKSTPTAPVPPTVETSAANDSAPEVTPQQDALEHEVQNQQHHQTDARNSGLDSPSLALLKAADAPEFKPANFTSARPRSSNSSPRSGDANGRAYPPQAHQYTPEPSEWVPVSNVVTPPVLSGPMWDHGVGGGMGMMMVGGMPMDISHYAYSADPTVPSGLYVPQPQQMVYLTDPSGNAWYADAASMGVPMPMAILGHNVWPVGPGGVPTSMPTPLNVDAASFTPAMAPPTKPIDPFPQTDSAAPSETAAGSDN